MTSATFAHGRVTGNIPRLPGNQFRTNGRPCDAFGPDLGVTLAMRDVHDHATLASTPRFRLVWPDAPER